MEDGDSVISEAAEKHPEGESEEKTILLYNLEYLPTTYSI